MDKAQYEPISRFGRKIAKIGKMKWFWGPRGPKSPKNVEKGPKTPKINEWWSDWDEFGPKMT